MAKRSIQNQFDCVQIGNFVQGDGALISVGNSSQTQTLHRECLGATAPARPATTDTLPDGATSTAARYPEPSRAEDCRIRILFLAANPSDTSRLLQDAEHREIQRRIDASGAAARCEIVTEPAARIRELTTVLPRHRPDMVHFTGHGTANGELLLTDDQERAAPISPQRVAELFALLSLEMKVRCVFLSACYSAPVARVLSAHVDFALGAPSVIEDKVAVIFAGAFYGTLGRGASVDTAYRYACLQVAIERGDGAECPLLYSRLDPRTFRLLG